MVNWNETLQHIQQNLFQLDNAILKSSKKSLRNCNVYLLDMNGTIFSLNAVVIFFYICDMPSWYTGIRDNYNKQGMRHCMG